MDIKKYVLDIEKETFSEIDYLDLMTIDINGQIRHVSIPRGYIKPKIFKNGIGFDASNFGFAQVDKSDMVAIPDTKKAYLEKKDEYRILHIFCDVLDPFTGEVFAQYPRNIVKNTKKYLQDENIAEDVKMLVELEMYVFDSVNYSTNIDHSYFYVESQEGIGESYSTIPRFSQSAGYHKIYPEEKYFTFRNEVVSTFENLGIAVKYHHHEVGAAQLEIELDFMSLIDTADSVCLAFWVLKEIADEMGLYVTLMPKPMYKMPGNGMHVHQFLVKNEESIFLGEKDHGLSDEALGYVCGILDHSLTGSLLAFTNPSTNAYRRLVPGYEAPISATFAKGSRCAAIRVPGYLKKNEVRIEFRTGDAACNIYYSLSAMVLAGIDGIKKKENPNDMGYVCSKSVEEKVFPLNLLDVMKGLKKDNEYLTKVFPEELINKWVRIKTEEARYIYNAPTPQEYEIYF